MENLYVYLFLSLHRRHNDYGGVSNHQPHGCLLNRLFRHRSKKTSKLRATGRWGPVTRKLVPFDDVIMLNAYATSPIQTILYQFNWDCKGLKQTVATQHPGLIIWAPFQRTNRKVWKSLLTSIGFNTEISDKICRRDVKESVFNFRCRLKVRLKCLGRASVSKSN